MFRIYIDGSLLGTVDSLRKVRRLQRVYELRGSEFAFVFVR